MATGSSREAAIAAITRMVGADALCSVHSIAERLKLTELAVELGIPRRSLRRVFNTVEYAAVAVRLAMLAVLERELDAIHKRRDYSAVMLRDVCACLVASEHVGFYLDHEDVQTKFKRLAISAIDAAIFKGGFDEGLYCVEDGANGAAEFVFDVIRGLVMATDGSKRHPDPWIDERGIDRFESHMRLIVRALSPCAHHVIFTEMTERDRSEGGIRFARKGEADEQGGAGATLGGGMA